MTFLTEKLRDNTMEDKLMYCNEENNYFKNFNYWLKSPSIRPGQLVLTVPSISNFA